MATALSTLVPRVNIKAKMAPQPLVLFALRDAAAEFCRQTNIVTEILPNIPVVAATAEYSLATTAAPTLTRGVMAMEVWLDDKQLDPATAADLAADEGQWTTKTGTPRKYMQTTEGVLRLFPIPEASGTLVVRAATAPTLTATSVDDALADRWWKALVAGALSQLLDMADEPFFDANGAAVQLGIFTGFVDEAKSVAHKGYTRARTRVRAHNF